MQQGPSDVERLFKRGSGNLIAMLRLPAATVGSWLIMFQNSGARGFRLCRPQVVILVLAVTAESVINPKTKKGLSVLLRF